MPSFPTRRSSDLGSGSGGTTYRVNAGGSELSSAVGVWSGDTAAAPSPRTNWGATGLFGTGSAIDMSDPSVPAGTPMALLQSQRWDPGGAPEMQWAFPEANGDYEVRLYFAEIYGGTARVGG